MRQRKNEEKCVLLILAVNEDFDDHHCAFTACQKKEIVELKRASVLLRESSDA